MLCYDSSKGPARVIKVSLLDGFLKVKQIGNDVLGLLHLPACVERTLRLRLPRVNLSLQICRYHNQYDVSGLIRTGITTHGDSYGVNGCNEDEEHRDEGDELGRDSGLHCWG